MKTLFFLLAMGFGMVAVAQTKYNPKYMQIEDKALRAVAKRMTPTGWIEFDEKAQVKRDDFFEKYGKAIGLQKDYSLKSESDILDQMGYRHELYQLYYQNIKVEGVQYSLHSKKGIVTLAHGRIIDFVKADLNKVLKQDKLWQELGKHVKYKAEKYEKKKPEAEMVITMKDESDYTAADNFSLAYKLNMEVLDERGDAKNHDVYLNAETGDLIKKNDLERGCFHQNPNWSPLKAENQQSPPLVLHSSSSPC
jgi:hypothetical protein